MKLIIIIFLILMLFSGSAVADWNVTWTPVKESIIDKEYIITVQNLQDVKRDVNISSFFAETNFDISGLSDTKFYEWKLVPHTYTVDHYTYIDHNDYDPINGTWNNWTESVFDFTETIESEKLDWKACKSLVFKETGTTKEDNYGFINIPALGSKPKDDGTFNGTKTFMLKFKTPIIYTNSYGSNGKVALLLDNVEYHPYWNVSWSARKEIILTGHSSLSLDNPIEDGYIYDTSAYNRFNTSDFIRFGRDENPTDIYRGYMEWDISTVPSDAIILGVKLKYHGGSNNLDGHIHEMIGTRPSTSGNRDVYNETGEGTVYADVAGFPVVGTNQEIDLGVDAVSDLQSTITNGWFAIGLQGDGEPAGMAIEQIYSEDYASVNPKPTLYIEYGLTDYQILLNVSYETGMQTDFDDLRFCNDTDEIDSWLESKVDSSYALVWVEFPTTPANTINQTYYMYYGNGSVSSNWDIDATFLFGDDFEGTPNWTLGGSAAISTTYARQGTKSVKLVKGTGSPTSKIIRQLTIPSSGFSAYAVFCYFSGSVPTGTQYISFTSDGVSTWGGPHVYQKIETGTICMAIPGSHVDTLYTPSSGSWYKIEIIIDHANDDYDVYINDVLKNSNVAYINTSTFDGASMYQQTSSWSNNVNDCYIDDTYSRKYVANPPTYAFGSTQYYTDSIHYNVTNPYNHTIDLSGVIAVNRSIVATDDINWSATSLTDDCQMVVTEYNLSKPIIADFTLYTASLDWLKVTNLTVSVLYNLQFANGTMIEQHNADANGTINFTTNLTPNDYQIVLGDKSVNITLYSSSPGCIFTNYTGVITGNYIVESNYPLNYSSLAFLMGVNHTPTSDMHSYLKVPANSIAADGIYRAHNRNTTPYMTWEGNNSITGGDPWRWSGGDNDSFWISKSQINSTHTWINMTGIASNVFPSMFYLGRQAMYVAPKTGIEINRHQGIIIKMFDLEGYRDRNNDYYVNMYFDTLLESTTPTENINLWYCNDSLDPLVDDPTECACCLRMDTWASSRWMDHEDWQPHTNVSYSKPLTAYAGTHPEIPPDEIVYLYLASDTVTSKSYVLNATNHDPELCNITYAQTNTMWTYDELSDTSTAIAYTPSFYATFVRNYEEFLHHLYIANDQDVWGHSDIYNISIGISDVPPTYCKFNYYWWNDTTDYYMNGSYSESFYINLTYGFDPDNGIALTHVLSLYDEDYNFITFVNDSLVGNAADTDIYFDISEHTTKYFTNNYRFKVVSTDNEGSISVTWSKVFEIPRERWFYQTSNILQGFPTAMGNILSTFLSFLPLLVGILISGFLLIISVGIFSKFKRW